MKYLKLVLSVIAPLAFFGNANATESVVTKATGASDNIDFLRDSGTSGLRPLIGLMNAGGTFMDPMPSSGGTVFVLPTTTGGLANFPFTAAASDNHQNIKATAGQVYHISVTNASTTVNWLRLYNAGAGFNGCNSATNLTYHMAIPANTTAAGFVEDIGMGLAFSTGISACVTGAYPQNDTTAAVAGAITVNIMYK